MQVSVWVDVSVFISVKTRGIKAYIQGCMSAKGPKEQDRRRNKEE
jgi:hypothetical protein